MQDMKSVPMSYIILYSAIMKNIQAIWNFSLNIVFIFSEYSV